MTLLDDALELVAIDSVSRNEGKVADLVEAKLSKAPHLEVLRIGDNVVARTRGTRETRVLIAGHLDTVPGRASEARIDQEVLYGVGSCDMKGSIAVMLRHAVAPDNSPMERTWVFYAREEIAHTESGLLEIAAARPSALHADVALLAEPTGGAVEAGCQGTMRVGITLAGTRAHTARPWVGTNALHRLGYLISRVAAYEPRAAEVDGLTYTEQLQVVAALGGVAPNVVPDVARCTLNHRVAPDRDKKAATEWLKEFLGDALGPDDQFNVEDWAPPAPPSLEHPKIAQLIAATGAPARAKLGWTDVASFHTLGVPAANFGAGDPLRAHRSDEFVTLRELTAFDRALGAFLG